MGKQILFGYNCEIDPTADEAIARVELAEHYKRTHDVKCYNAREFVIMCIKKRKATKEEAIAFVRHCNRNRYDDTDLYALERYLDNMGWIKPQSELTRVSRKEDK